MVTALRSLDLGYSTARPFRPFSSSRFTTKSGKSAMRTSHCGTTVFSKRLEPNGCTYSFVYRTVLPRNDVHDCLLSSSHGLEP